MNIFNPEHDLCMANGDANFVPPFSALEFGRDCAGLTSYIQKAGDGEIVPWGWDAVLKQRLVKQGVPVSPSLRTRRSMKSAGCRAEELRPTPGLLSMPMSRIPC